MAQGCTPGHVQRWTWFHFPESKLPEEGDVAIRASTGSCWLVLSVKPSRKGGRWYSIRAEGLGIGAADLEDDHTFGIVSMSHEDHEAIRIYERLEREGVNIDAAHAAAN